MGKNYAKKGITSPHRGYEKFINAADLKHDEVTIVLRSHLLVEYYLDQIILLNIPRGDVLLDQKFSFIQKTYIVESLEVLPERLINSVKNLNSIRNRCSHDLDYKISEVDVDKIGMPFGKSYLEIKRDHFDSIKTLLHWTIGALFITKLDSESTIPGKE